MVGFVLTLGFWSKCRKPWVKFNGLILPEDKLHEQNNLFWNKHIYIKQTFNEEWPTPCTIPVFCLRWRNYPENLLDNGASYQFCTCCYVSTISLVELGWAGASDCAMLCCFWKGFLQLYSTLWFCEGAPINISSYIFLHMIFIANYIYEIVNTSSREWCVRSLLLLSNRFKPKAVNCFSAYDSSLNPWALLLKLGRKRHFEMNMKGNFIFKMQLVPETRFKSFQDGCFPSCWGKISGKKKKKVVKITTQKPS